MRSNAVNYTYYGDVTKIIDGDTLDLDIQLGFRISTHQRLRFLGINAPETRGKERAEGLKSKAWLKERIPVGTRIKIETHKAGKYGRWIAVIYVDDREHEDDPAIWTNINQQMLDLGLAKQYGR